MSRLLGKFWSDDTGALVATELLFVLSMLVVGTLTGLTALRQALVTELVESANAMLALDQSYSFSGQSIPGVASTAGSSAVDHTGTISVGAAAATQAVINQSPCE